MARLKRNDLEMYETFAADWWKEKASTFRSLQAITKFRLELISKWFPDVRQKVVVDLGCGGGLLAAPLSFKGAKIIGVDLSPASLREAGIHSHESAVYLRGDIRNVPLPKASADIVLLADVLDHLPDFGKAVAEASRLLKPGGFIFVSTINRNFLSKLLAIQIGENIGLVPPGTHDYQLLIRPAELEREALACGLRVHEWQGERPDLIQTLRNWSIHFAPCKSLSIAYSALLGS